MPRTVAVEVFPGRGTDEGEFIGGDADDIAGVVFVKLSLPVGLCAVPSYEGDGEFCGCCKEGAREFGEGMEIDIVEGFSWWVDDYLEDLVIFGW